MCSYPDFALAPANINDLTVGVELLEEQRDLDVLGDKAFISAPVAARRRAEAGIALLTVPRQYQRVQRSAAFDAVSAEAVLDAFGADEPSVLVVVVAAVGVPAVGLGAGPADTAADRRHLVTRGYELGDVVAVAAGRRHRQRGAVAVGQHAVFRARSCAVDRARTRVWAALERPDVGAVEHHPRPVQLPGRRERTREGADGLLRAAF